MSNNRLFFVIVQNELIVLYKIKSFLRMGSVQKHGKYYRFIITKNLLILRLQRLVMSYILFPKIFYRICCIFNLSLQYSYPLKFKFLTNSWLSGFVDADGCFHIRLLKRPNYRLGYQIRLLFILDQKCLNDDDLSIFYKLKLELMGSIICRKNMNYRFIVEKENEIKKLISYFSNFPLKSHKKSLQYRN